MKQEIQALFGAIDQFDAMLESFADEVARNPDPSQALTRRMLIGELRKRVDRFVAHVARAEEAIEPPSSTKA